MKFQKIRMRKDESAVLDIEVPAVAKTLTFIATDGEDGIGSDLLFIGDPKLIPEASDASPTDTEVAELKKLRVVIQQLEAELKALPKPFMVYAVVSEENHRPSKCSAVAT